MTENEASKIESGGADGNKRRSTPVFLQNKMFGMIVLILLALETTTFAATKQDYDNILSEVQIEIKKGNKGDTDKAIAYCNQAITLNPNRSEGYAIRCNFYADKNYYKSAVWDCEKALQLDKSIMAYKYNILLHIQMQDYDKAIVLLQNAINSYSQDKIVYRFTNMLGQVYCQKYIKSHKQVDFDNSLKYLNQSSAIDPTNWINYHFKGALYTKQNTYNLKASLKYPPFAPKYANEAIYELDKAIKLAPKDAELAETYSHRSSAYLVKYLVTCEQKHLDEALKDEKKAIELKPQASNYKVLSLKANYNEIYNVCLMGGLNSSSK